MQSTFYNRWDIMILRNVLNTLGVTMLNSVELQAVTTKKAKHNIHNTNLNIK